MSRLDDKETTTQRVSRATLSKVKNLLAQLHANSFDEAVDKLVNFRQRASNDTRVKNAVTNNLELEHKVPCSHRWPIREGELYDGRKWCGRTSIDRPIKSIEKCAVCKFRNPSKQSLRTMVAIQEKRPFVISKELGIRDFRASKEHIRLQIEGNSYFWTCNPKGRYTEAGFEVKCDQCPNHRVKGEWHPVEICKEVACPFLKPLEKKIRKKHDVPQNRYA